MSVEQEVSLDGDSEFVREKRREIERKKIELDKQLERARKLEWVERLKKIPHMMGIKIEVAYLSKKLPDGTNLLMYSPEDSQMTFHLDELDIISPILNLDCMARYVFTELDRNNKTGDQK